MVSKKQQQSNLTNFFEVEYSSLKNYVRSKIKQTADSDAEDVIQDVALRIFSRPLDALPIHNIGGFVYNAIRNRIIDIMRVKKERVGDERTLERLWIEFAGLFYENVPDFYSDNLMEQLQLAIDELKPVYKDIIIAVDFEGYTYKEIAEDTGIPSGTLMSRRHRAMAILTQKLELIKE